MKVKDVYIMEEVVEDLNEAGIHRKKLNFYQMFAKRFPYAISFFNDGFAS